MSFHFMSVVTIHSDSGAQENKSLSLFPLCPHLFATKWWDQMPWSSFFEYWVLNQLFHSLISPSLRACFGSFSLSAIRVESSSYLRLLIFLPNLDSSWASSSPAFSMMCNAGDLGLIPGFGRSPGEGNVNPLQYSCLGNPMDTGAW